MLQSHLFLAAVGDLAPGRSMLSVQQPDAAPVAPETTPAARALFHTIDEISGRGTPTPHAVRLPVPVHSPLRS